MRCHDPDAFHSHAWLRLVYLRKRYCHPASKWFGHILGRFYFRKFWVKAPNRG